MFPGLVIQLVEAALYLKVGIEGCLNAVVLEGCHAGRS